MNNLELSNEFDVMYNNIMGGENVAPGLDEYEKSVFLTKAQNQIVKDYFNPRLNKPMQGFDGSEVRQIDFSMIMRVAPITSFTNAQLDNRNNSKRAEMPEGILAVVNEFVDVQRDGKAVRLSVYPIEYTEYARLMSKPYKRPVHYQAWRIVDSTNNKKEAEFIVGTNDTIQKYTIRYVKTPRAIILQDLDGDVSLDGVQTAQECELDPMIHHEILQRAVELAKAAYVGDLSSQIALGQSSQTEIGVVAQSR